MPDARPLSSQPNIARAIEKLSNGAQLAPLLDQAECVSFDFFDTLFARPFTPPELVFDLIERQSGIRDFRQQRIAAQHEAFRRMHQHGRKEIRLDDIYACFDMPAEEQRRIAKLEQDLELVLLAPKPEVLDLYHALHAAGVKLAICSDMYLPRVFFEQALRQHDIKQMHWLLISAEENATKRDAGELFVALVRHTGLPAHKILHIGDNHAADVQRAEQSGLLAFHYAADHPSQTERSAKIATLHGLWERCQADEADAFHRLGFLYAGTANWGYLHWLSEQAQADGIDHLLFLSRDGYLLERLAQRNNAPKLPDHHYFTGSRVAYYLAAITENNFSDFLPYLLSGSEGLKPRELFERIGVTPPAPKVMADLGLGDEIRMENSLHEKLAGLFYAWRGEILRVCARNRRALHLYLNSLGIHAGSKIGLVDVGWSGSTQDALQAAISPWLDVEVQGYYFVLADTTERRQRETRQRMRGMYSIDNLGEQTLWRLFANRALIELFFSAPHATIIGWRIDADAQITPIMDAGRGGDPRAMQRISQSIIEGAEHFADCYQRLIDGINAKLSPDELAQPLLHFAAFEQKQAQALAEQIINFDTWSSSSNQRAELLSYA